MRAEIDHITCAYDNKIDFFVETLSQGIGMIAAAFYPRARFMLQLRSKIYSEIGPRSRYKG